MEKIVLEFSEQKNKSYEFEGQIIKVKPYLSLNEQANLINKYAGQYFSPSSRAVNVSLYDYFTAEYTLMVGVLDVCTNVQVANEEGEVILDVAKLVASGLWAEVISRISNYEHFKTMLDYIIEDIRSQFALQQSVGTVLDNAVENITAMIHQIVEKFSGVELTPEFLNEMMEASKKVVKNVEQSSAAEVFVEAEKFNSEKSGVKRGRKPKSK